MYGFYQFIWCDQGFDVVGIDFDVEFFVDDWLYVYVVEQFDYGGNVVQVWQVVDGDWSIGQQGCGQDWQC